MVIYESWTFGPIRMFWWRNRNLTRNFCLPYIIYPSTKTLWISQKIGKSIEKALVKACSLKSWVYRRHDTENEERDIRRFCRLRLVISLLIGSGLLSSNIRW